jgi:carotenoid cleavage dioxygenase-like enzyme
MPLESEVNPYLQGNFGPWRSEGDHADLKVIGEIPRELNGTYYRNGPNPAFEPMGKYHWFDGDGMIHAVTLENGKARYSNRWVASAGLAEEQSAGKALYRGLSDMPELTEAPKFKNTGNTNIIQHAGKLLALMEGALPTRLEQGSLKTAGEYDFAGKLKTAMTAHPKFDPETGEMLFFGYAPFPPYLTYHVADKDGNLVRSEEIDLEWPSMIHDFCTTRDYVIFILSPLVFSIENLVNSGKLFSWEGDRGLRLGVMPRNGGNADVRWFRTDPGYVFHPMNAYADGDTLRLDVARFDRLVFMDPPEVQRTVTEDTSPHPHRWTIDLKAGSVKSERLDDVVAEFPRVDDRLNGLPHRYGYMAANLGSRGESGAVEFDAVLKYDQKTGKRETHHFKGKGCGEAVFAPRSSTAAEDEGFLMTFVYDPEKNGSEFVILDARNVAGEPLARVQMPHRVPYGFHGNWVGA